ncbi:sentrin-specific protease 7-like [Trachinotus anak]|uniref:sentrin-specific protease 7-like n=1 Tax=Trachinotus anak TaxID=443729 RepID=UPI0039F264A1
MASQFKIPKKKQPTGSDSTHLHLQSPLSRLQSPAPQFKAYGNQSYRGGAGRMHAGNTLGSSANRQSRPCKPLFRDMVKTLLDLNSPNRGAASAANHRSPGSSRSQSQPGQRAESSSASASNGWRPKRASDRLLQPEVTSERRLSPPQKRKNAESSDSSLSTKSISVESVDFLAKLRGEEHAGSRSPSTLGARTWRRVESGRDAAEDKGDRGKPPDSSVSGSDQTSDDDFVSSSTNVVLRPSSSSPVKSPKTTPDGRRNLNRMAWMAASGNLKEDVREKERQRWREFRERKTVLQLRLRTPKQSPAEPIVLSSEEEVEGEDDGDTAKRTSQSSSRADQSRLENSNNIQGQQNQVCSSRAEEGLNNPPVTRPSFLQLEFTSLHAGLTHADAGGKMTITEDGITVPLKGVEEGEEGEVTVVASQVRGYGVWDGGVARGGALLARWEGPAPSLLFLWVTGAQANLLQRELSALQNSTPSGPSCSFLLLVLKEQLQELQAALLASILDMEEYKRERSHTSSSSSGGPTSPLDWTDGLLLLHSCPPPLDQHLLGLLGHSAEESRQVRGSQRNKRCSLNSSGLQQLPTRLIQYPAAPCKGRISVTKEDLACLDIGEFLNDVIIDFYLK